MTYPEFRNGTPVIYSSTLGYIVAPRRMYGQNGYNVVEAEPNGDPGQGIKTHWIAAWTIAPVEVGRNVCDRPFPFCPCALRVHVRKQTLAKLLDVLGKEQHA